MPAILGGAFPLPATPKGCENGAFIYRNDANVKTLSNLFLGFPEYGMTNGSNFKWDLPPASNPQRVIKGSLI